MRREAALPALDDAPPVELARDARVSRTVPLSAVSEVRVSNVDKKSEPGELPVRLCNYTDVYKNDYITEDLEFMRATASRAEVARFGLRPGDVIITKDSETPDDIGIPSLVDEATADLVCGYHLAMIRPSPEKVDPAFLAKQLAQPRIARYFGQQANGSTRYGLSIAAIERAPIWLPSIEQQRAASGLLRTIDSSIAETKAVTSKLRQIHLGLMQQLLLRGIDENGEVRDRHRHQENFEDTVIGLKPVSWSVKQLGEIVPAHRKITYGIVQPGPLVPDGVLLIRGQDYIGGWAQLDNFFRVAPVLHQSYRRSTTFAGDLIVCIVGATTGSVAQVPDWIEEANITQTTARVSCNLKIVDPRFIFHVLQSEIGQRQVRKYVKGSAQPGLNLADVEVFKVPVPSLDEQVQIAKVLDDSLENIGAWVNELDKLQKLKIAVAHHVLSGSESSPVSLQSGGF
jgi:type I restriction enzyme S subunit